MKKGIVILAFLALPLIAWEGTYHSRGDSEGGFEITDCKVSKVGSVCAISIGSIGGMDASGAPHFCDFMGKLVVDKKQGKVFLEDNGEGSESLEFILEKRSDTDIYLKPMNNGENQYLYCGMNARIMEDVYVRE